jgi:hypothetical protein
MAELLVPLCVGICSILCPEEVTPTPAKAELSLETEEEPPEDLDRQFPMMKLMLDVSRYLSHSLSVSAFRHH